MADASTFNDIASGVEAVVTGGGVRVGGTWIYFRFVKDRAYRPRLQLELNFRAIRIGEDLFGVAALSATNIGSSKIRIRQKGSGISLWLPAEFEPHVVPDWAGVYADAVFEHHKWIESEEEAVEEVLIPLGPAPQSFARIEARLVVPRTWRKSIAFHTARVVRIDPVTSEIDGRAAQGGAEDCAPG